MIEKLSIKQFKSIKDLKIDCKKVNIFIGEPNTGKSNLLEALGLFSINYSNGNIKDYLRIQDMTNLFYDSQVSEVIEIDTGLFKCSISFIDDFYYLGIEANDEYGRKAQVKNKYNVDVISQALKFDPNFRNPIKFFSYKPLQKYENTSATGLRPPFGDNLFTILNTNKEAAKFVNNLINTYGYRLSLDSRSKSIGISKESDYKLIIVPIGNIADTFLRVIFYSLAIMTNQNSIIVFDEPDAYTFPYYTKYLAEKIGRDETNQYFIVTHNPYFLTSIIEKTNIVDISIHVANFDENQTKVISFSPNEIQDITDIDSSIFFNLKTLIESKK